MTNKKKMLLIGILLLFILAIVLLSRATSDRRQGTSCTRMIAGIQQLDAGGTYSMFSSSTRQLMSLETWTEEVGSLHALYGVAEPELRSSEETTNPIDGDRIITEEYVVNSGSGPWIATCTFYESDGGAIGNFSNEAGV